MLKKKTFEFPMGKCEYEHSSSVYSFSVYVDGDLVCYVGYPSSEITKDLFSDELGIYDTARGLMIISQVGLVDRSFVDKYLSLCKQGDWAIPTLAGCYYNCLLGGGNTSIPDDFYDNMFRSSDGKEYFKRIIGGIYDYGDHVAVDVPKILGKSLSEIAKGLGQDDYSVVVSGNVPDSIANKYTN